MKTVERETARKLRAQGRSVKELARLLKVSPSSISLWVRDIELTEDQQEELRRRGNIAATASIAARGVVRRRQFQDEGRSAARERNLLHVAGCMLFWAEGSRERNKVDFVNSDPAMVSFFLRFLRTCFDVPDSKMRITCNLFADHAERQRKIEEFWLNVTGLPRVCLRKSTVNRYSKYSKKRRRNKLPYGTCRITVYDTRIVQGIYGAIQEYADFDREEWLM